MLNENIRNLRKAKGLSQEELAIKLNVVRQTISKWEKGLSVPDAGVLIHMAELLDVSVGSLLDIETDSSDNLNLSEELEQLNKQLAKKNRWEKLVMQAGKKRELILFLSIAAMLIALIVKNEIVSILLVGACMLAAVIILYRNLALLTSITTDDLKIGVLRITTIFNILVLAIGIIFAILVAFDIFTFSENGEKMFAMALVSCVMIFAGIISPKLSYSRHTGLRLPWTICDEDTWNIAHSILGYISLPIALLYITCALTISNFEIVTICAMAAWVGIPGVVSYLFSKKKMSGK